MSLSNHNDLGLHPETPLSLGADVFGGMVDDLDPMMLQSPQNTDFVWPASPLPESRSASPERQLRSPAPLAESVTLEMALPSTPPALVSLPQIEKRKRTPQLANAATNSPIGLPLPVLDVDGQEVNDLDFPDLLDQVHESANEILSAVPSLPKSSQSLWDMGTASHLGVPHLGNYATYYDYGNSTLTGCVGPLGYPYPSGHANLMNSIHPMVGLLPNPTHAGHWSESVPISQPWVSADLSGAAGYPNDMDNAFPHQVNPLPPINVDHSRPTSTFEQDSSEPSSYRPPELLEPSYNPQGNRIAHKRGAKNIPAPDFYPKWKFIDWGFSGRGRKQPMFRYHPSGEWRSQLAFSSDELAYYFEQTKRSLVIWIQHQPAQYTHRFAQSSASMKCRFKGCIAKNRTILKGFWRVAFDERAHLDDPQETGTKYDPFLNAGYVHLYCIEKHFDIMDLIARFDIRPDNRTFRFEQRNPMKISRDYVELADSFTNWHCTRKNAIHRGEDPRERKRGENRLWYRLTLDTLELENNGRKRHRVERGGINLEVHMGNLRKFCFMQDQKLIKDKARRAKEKQEEFERAALGIDMLRDSTASISSPHQSPTPQSLDPLASHLSHTSPQVSLQGIKRAAENDGRSLVKRVKVEKSALPPQVSSLRQPLAMYSSPLSPLHHRERYQDESSAAVMDLGQLSKSSLKPTNANPTPAPIQVDQQAMSHYQVGHRQKCLLRRGSAPS